MVHRCLFTCFVFLLPSVSWASLYTDYQVIRIIPQTERHVMQLKALSNRQNSCHKLDFWTSATSVRKAVDIMVPPSSKTYIKLCLDLIGAPYHVLISDVNEVIAEQEKSRKSRVKTKDLSMEDSSHDFFEEYHNLEEIRKFTDELLEKYPDILTEIKVAESYENREMKALKISVDYAQTQKKKTIWWESGIHAREWISPATLMYITNQLLEDFATGSPLVTQFLEQFDVYVLFVTNPDGYQYTFDENRLWRKTRSPNDGSECIGTDPNRNWPFKWGGEGSSDRPCHETYHGAYPASESEIKGVSDFVASLQNLVMFIDFHSYSQLVLYPWGFAEDLPPIKNVNEVDELARTISDGIESMYGRSYEYGNSATVLYAAAGASDDYAYAIGARFSYVIELPDKGRYGFLLPEEEILPTGEETYAGMMTAIDYLLKVKW